MVSNGRQWAAMANSLTKTGGGSPAHHSFEGFHGLLSRQLALDDALLYTILFFLLVLGKAHKTVGFCLEAPPG